jgi:hypothetical protein
MRRRADARLVRSVQSWLITPWTISSAAKACQRAGGDFDYRDGCSWQLKKYSET